MKKSYWRLFVTIVMVGLWGYSARAGNSGLETENGKATEEITAATSAPKDGFALLDGFGGIHGVGVPIVWKGLPWFGWDVARDLEAGSPSETLYETVSYSERFYVLDGYGGIHTNFPEILGEQPPPYFGWDIAKDMEILKDHTGGFVLDGYGLLHPFGEATLWASQASFGWDIAEDLEAAEDAGFYVLDGYGRVTSLGATAQVPFPYFGWDIARDITVEIGQEVSVSAGVEMDVPDLDPKGVSSDIVLNESRLPSDMTITVRVIHDFPTDFEARLRHPSGQIINLFAHQRPGDNEGMEGIFKMTLSNCPDLKSLTSLSPEGTWTLTIADTIWRDEGRMVAWTISFIPTALTMLDGYGGVYGIGAIPLSFGPYFGWDIAKDLEFAPHSGVSQETTFDQGSPVIIPEQPGLKSSLTFEEDALIHSAVVFLEGEHNRPGDLDVILQSSDGESLTIVKNGVGLERVSYGFRISSEFAPLLNQLRGKRIKGDWNLTVIDHYAGVNGSLIKWTLVFDGRTMAVLDGFGGVHSIPQMTFDEVLPYFGWDIAKDLEYISVVDTPTETPTATVTPTFTDTPTVTPTWTPGGPLIHVDLPGLQDDALPLTFAIIPPGTFSMGSPDTEEGHTADEAPVHSVTIEYSFAIGRHEVTEAQWLSVMGTMPSRNSSMGKDYPVRYMRWSDISGTYGFLAKINSLGMGTFRLPSESEWEYSCRGGTTTRFHFGDSLGCDTYSDCAAGGLPGNRSDYMWFYGSQMAKTVHPVGMLLPNQFLLFDMHGNVREWCEDLYHSSYIDAPTDGSAWLEGTGDARMVRGGDYNDWADFCRSAERSITVDGAKNVGLRLVMELSQ